MISIRRSQDRGHINHGWLDTYHTFSFSEYHDPKFMGFRTLRVINEDIVQPGEGFGTHPHRDMEIITYIIKGALEHKDSMGNGSVIKPGDVQYMSAGRGVTHSEFNPSKSEFVHLLQIWVLPEAKGLEPRYDQKHFSEKEKLGSLRLVASRDGLSNTISVRQDIKLYECWLNKNQSVMAELASGRYGWLQVFSGELQIGGRDTLKAGDGASISEEASVSLSALTNNTAFLFFDLN